MVSRKTPCGGVRWGGGFKLVLLMQNLILYSDAVKTNFMQSFVCAYSYLLLIYVYTCLLFFVFLNLEESSFLNYLKTYFTLISLNLFIYLFFFFCLKKKNP